MARRWRVHASVAAVTIVVLCCCGLPRVARAAGEATTLETTGEAAVVLDDVPSARLEAIARARWEAVERVAGVEIKSSTFIDNFALLDDAIIKRANGVITQSAVLSEGRTGDVFTARIRSTVAPAPARSVLSAMARNRAIAVYLPARFPDHSMRDSHALAETLISRLTRDGYDVIDLADHEFGVSPQQLDAALARDDFTSMRSVLYRYLTNVVLVGTVGLVHSAKRGDNDSLGRLQFDIVTARVDYRLVGGDDTGLRRILSSGHESAKGTGAGATSAAEHALERLASQDPDSAATVMLEEIRRTVKAKTGRVRVSIDGVSSLGADQSVRETLQAIAWVTRIESERMGEYVVDYPEQSLYLAASLGHKPGFYVKDFTPSSITARFQAR